MGGLKTLYSGTAKENYTLCAYLDDDGQVYYDKSRCVKKEHPELHRTPDISEAVTHAISTAKIAKSIPMILVSYEHSSASLVTQKPIRVERVYMFKEEVGWQEHNPYKSCIKALLEIASPKELIKG